VPKNRKASHGLPEEQSQIYHMARQFADEKMLPNAAEWDQKEVFPSALRGCSSSFFEVNLFVPRVPFV